MFVEFNKFMLLSLSDMNEYYDEFKVAPTISRAK